MTDFDVFHGNLDKAHFLLFLEKFYKNGNSRFLTFFSKSFRLTSIPVRLALWIIFNKLCSVIISKWLATPATFVHSRRRSEHVNRFIAKEWDVGYSTISIIFRNKNWIKQSFNSSVLKPNHGKQRNTCQPLRTTGKVFAVRCGVLDFSCFASCISRFKDNFLMMTYFTLMKRDCFTN